MKQKKRNISLSFLAALLFAIAMPLHGQEEVPENAIAAAMALSPEQIVHVTEDMTSYISQVSNVQDNIVTASKEDIKELQSRLESIDVQWQAYTQIAQVDITASPVLMDLLSQYKMVFTATTDSLASQQKRLEALDDYSKAHAFIMQSKEEYLNMESQAMKYSLVPQTATLLAEVKAKEALLFAQVTENYQKALAASQVSDVAKERFATLQNEYLEITKISEKIKATAYKPWVERIKDYVLTFAGIAIILIFFNFLVTKIKAIKQARDLAKKYEGMLNSNDDYPTI